jgi:extracellular matrix regulatory protein A
MWSEKAMKLIQIGFGNMVSRERIIAIVSPDSSPIKRLVQDARDRGTCIDASSGRKTKSVILMDSDHVILSSIPPQDIEKEFQKAVRE